jgi:hypothetical protein
MRRISRFLHPTQVPLSVLNLSKLDSDIDSHAVLHADARSANPVPGGLLIRASKATNLGESARLL